MYMIVQVLNQCYDNTVYYASAAAPIVYYSEPLIWGGGGTCGQGVSSEMGTMPSLEARIAIETFH